jgi:hypothetical protein
MEKKYLSYSVKYRDGQQTIIEWHTVEVVDGGKKVRNKQGVEIGIGPFLRLRHFFGDDPLPEYPQK